MAFSITFSHDSHKICICLTFWERMYSSEHAVYSFPRKMALQSLRIQGFKGQG